MSHREDITEIILKNILIMAKGLDKAQTVRSVLEDRDFSLPVTGVAPIDGRLTWLLDSKAASLLDRNRILKT